MSQHILIKGTYRNNKTNLIGVLSPKNNTGFTVEDYQELNNKFNTYILPKIDKFKKIELIIYIEGKQVYNGNLISLNNIENIYKMSVRQLLGEIEQGRHPHYKYWYNIHKNLNYYN